MIYFVQAGQRGPVKIGFVEGFAVLPNRIRMLQTGNPIKLALLTTMHGGLDRERELHEQFAASRLAGEWFAFDTPGLHELIDRATDLNTAIENGETLCTHCYARIVEPPRRRLCSEQCEVASKRAKTRAWKAARR